MSDQREPDEEEPPVRWLPPGSVDDTSDEDALAWCEEEGMVWVHGYGWLLPEDAEAQGFVDEPDDEA